MGFAIVEVMGHRVYAGRIEETTLAGSPVLRVHVPEVVRERVEHDWRLNEFGAEVRWERDVRTRYPAYTVDLGGGALFAVTRCSEAAALEVAASRTYLGHAEPERTEGEWRPRAPALTGPVEDAVVLEDHQDERPDDADEDPCAYPGCTRPAERGLSLCEPHWDEANDAEETR